MLAGHSALAMGLATLAEVTGASVGQLFIWSVFPVMADDIETVRRVGLQRTHALIRDLEVCKAFVRLTPQERGLWEQHAEARAQAFCDGLAADLALMTTQDAEAG